MARTTKTKPAAPSATLFAMSDAPPAKAAAGRNVAVRMAAPPAAPEEVTAVGMLSLIASMAANQRVNAEKMRALVDIQKELAAEEQRRTFITAFIAMSAELPIINAQGRIEIESKKARRAAQSTPYATFKEIHRVVTPILRRHGFAMMFPPDAMPDGRLIQRGVLMHVSGYEKHGQIVLPIETSGSKNNVQGVGSSMSYGKRYLAINMLNIVSHAKEDADDDAKAAGKLYAEQVKAAAETQEVEIALIDAAQLKTLNEAIRFCGVSEKEFCKKYDIEHVKELPKASFQAAIAACKDYAERSGRGS